MSLTELWRTPSPSSGFESVSFQSRPHRVCVVAFRCEGSDGGWEDHELRFREVCAFKGTFLYGLTVEMIQSAYDKLVDMGSTPWLAETAASQAAHGGVGTLRHLRICFDDGPCYEFICAGFEAGRLGR